MNTIDHLEAATGSVIPDSVKSILTEPSDMNGRFIRRVDDTFDQELSIAGIMQIDQIIAAWNNLKNDPHFIGEQLLPLAETAGSPLLCVGIGPTNEGQLYVFDYDFGATKIAGSLREFLLTLY